MARLGPEAIAEAQALMKLYPDPRSALLPICHVAQAQDGWLAPDAMQHIAELIGITPAEVLGTASFYDMLHTRPVGRWLVGICTNIACMLSGADDLLEHAEHRLGTPAGGTSHDGRFTLEELECVAACDRAPCATVNWRFFGPLDAGAFDALVDDLASGRLDAVVPDHGVLTRVRREDGLQVTPEQVVTERAAMDRGVAERRELARQAEAARAAAAAAEEAARSGQASSGQQQSGGTGGD